MKNVLIALGFAVLSLTAIGATTDTAEARECAIFKAPAGTWIGSVYGSRNYQDGGGEGSGISDYTNRECFSSSQECQAWVTSQIDDENNDIFKHTCEVK